MKKVIGPPKEKNVFAFDGETPVRCKTITDALHRADHNMNIGRIKFTRNGKICFYVRTGNSTWREEIAKSFV